MLLVKHAHTRTHTHTHVCVYNRSWNALLFIVAPSLRLTSKLVQEELGSTALERYVPMHCWGISPIQRINLILINWNTWWGPGNEANWLLYYTLPMEICLFHSLVPMVVGEGKGYLSLSLLFTVCFYFDISVPCVVCMSIDCTRGWATRRTTIGLCSTRLTLTSHPGLPDASDRLACYHCLREEVGHGWQLEYLESLRDSLSDGWPYEVHPFWISPDGIFTSRRFLCYKRL